MLTGFPNYPSGVVSDGYVVRRSQDEDLGGVRVRRVALYPSHDASATHRLMNYASFATSALVNGMGILKGLDALWVNYSPITVALPMWAARFGLNVPLVTHVLDLWPDTLLAGGMIDAGRGYRIAEGPLHAWCRAMYASSDAVAYISPGVGEVLRQRGVPKSKLHFVPLWADEGVFRSPAPGLREELRIDPDAIVLVYAGSMGEAQGLSALVEACARVSDPRFVCLLAGSGIAEASLRSSAAAARAANVRFLGRLPERQMARLMATGDVNYVGLRPHPLSSITMPSKIQAALASGRALIVAAEGDAASIARSSAAGFVADPGDPASIAAAIADACEVGREGLHAMGRRGEDFYLQQFSAERGIRRIEQLLADSAQRAKKRARGTG